MMFFGIFKKKKKINDDNIRENKYAIEEMAASMDSIIFAIKDPDLKKRLEELQEKIKYFNPTCDSRALNLDKKIANLISDIKVDILKMKEDGYDKIENKVMQIEMLVPDRCAYANSKIKG